MKYLILKNNKNEFSLWSFYYFMDETYTYGDVLETIYGVRSAKDIVGITIKPEKTHWTEMGDAIEDEIRIFTYNDRKNIERLYDIIYDVKCFGAHDTFGYDGRDENRFTFSFSTDEKDKFVTMEMMRRTRRIKLLLKNAYTMDKLIYDGLAGEFYEYGGIQTEPLIDETAIALSELLGIK